MTGTNREPAGRAFTLVEVMAVVAILGIVMGMTVIALNSASTETSVNTTEAALQSTANRFAMRLVDELRNASRASVRFESNGTDSADHGDCIKFRVPVDWDDDDDVVDADGNAEYGTTFGRTHALSTDTDPIFIVYRFRANTVNAADEVIDENALGVDVNGDGDDDDSFKRGLFTRTAEGIGTEPARAVSDRWFLYGDEDGNGIEQPVFQLATDGTITIRLLAGDVVGRQKTPVRTVVTTKVRPFNP